MKNTGSGSASAYGDTGREMAQAAKKRAQAPKPPKEPEAELPAWLRGDAAGRAGLPKKPPGMGP